MYTDGEDNTRSTQKASRKKRDRWEADDVEDQNGGNEGKRPRVE